MGWLKVTGYIDTYDLASEDLDPTGDTGLSASGYEDLVAGRSLTFASLHGVEVTKEDD